MHVMISGGTIGLRTACIAPVATVIFIQLRLCMTMRLFFVALVPRWADSKD
jgi:hypothetical protein